MDVIVDLVSTGTDPAWQVTFPDGGDVAVIVPEETITWVIGSAPPRAEITAVTLGQGEPGPVTWQGDLPTAENGWTATDQNDLPPGSPPVSWDYTVTITYQGTPYISDPKITNQPPTHFMRLPPSTHLNRLPLNRLPLNRLPLNR
jgi:hypothetical protein